MEAFPVINLCVVIVNYRTAGFVTDCLSSLLPELEGESARVTVVDNCSEDGSIEIIEKWLAVHDTHQQVAVMKADRNGGFAAGNNLAIKAISARYYLLLNSDTVIREGAVRRLLETAGRFPDAGLLSPRLEWPDGTGQESCFRFHTPGSELIAAARTRFVERMLSRYVVPLPVQAHVARPQWTSFACVLIKGEVFRQVGLLDEGYFMYFEDVEFCHRARRGGWTIVHDPAARVVHLRGGSSPVKQRAQQKRRLPPYFYQSRTRLFFQLYGWWGLTAANLLWWLGRMISKMRQMLGRSDKAAIDRQWLDIWTNWRTPGRPYSHPARG